MSQILETLAKGVDAHHVREVPCAYLELGGDTNGLLPRDGTPEDNVALLLPASSAPLKEFLQAGQLSVEVREGSIYWHDAKGMVCQAGSTREPLDSRVLAAAQRADGVLAAFVNDANGAVPTNWIVLVGADLRVPA